LRDLGRQLNSDDDATRIEEALQADHRLQAKLHPSVVLLHDVVEILAGPDFHWIRTPEVELAIHSHHPQNDWVGVHPTCYCADACDVSAPGERRLARPPCHA